MTTTDDRPRVSALEAASKVVPRARRVRRHTVPVSLSRSTPSTPSTSAPGSAAAGLQRPAWERRYSLWLPVVDGSLLLAAAMLPPALSSRATLPDARGMLLVVGLVVGWLLALALSSAYEPRLLGHGPDEYKRVLTGCWRFAAVTTLVCYLLQTRVDSMFLTAMVPAGTTAVLVGRVLIRRGMASAHAHGHLLRRMIVVGPAFAVAEVVREVQRAGSGFQVVGVCTAGTARDAQSVDAPVLGDFGDILAVARANRADTVAVAGGAEMPRGFLRRLAWDIEGQGIDLMVAPAITDVAGPRIHVRPVANLSMIYVEEPQFRGVKRLVKGAIDRLAAAVLLVLLLPVLLVLAVLVGTTSRGGVLFAHERTGKHGERFMMLKFRTMRPGVPAPETSFAALHAKSGDDPRITRVGRLLRRTSMDELPQLLNVLRGDMSLVGPRPLIEREIQSMEGHELRRHLVKPGMTGLWQVSGRSDVTWEERVQMDLHYVENWTPLLDLVILIRTVAAVVSRAGAY